MQNQPAPQSLFLLARENFMRRIRYCHKRNRGVWGLAYPREWRIEVDPELDDKTLLDIAVHEVAHVVMPDLDEAAVDQLGRHAADVLWRLGFRRAGEE
jgi:hypothetical protein